MSERPLQGLAAGLVKDVKLVDGAPRLTPERLEHWATKFLDGVEAPRDVAAELIAFALKVAREVPRGAEEVLTQLVGLAGLLLLDADAAARMFEAGGGALSPEWHARATGFVASKVPVGAQGKVAGATSPLGARLKRD